MTDRERCDHEANLFAMALLMPEKLVRAELKRLGPIDLADDRATKALAKKFQVSETLMAIRLGQIMGSKFLKL